MKLGFIDYYLDEWHALNYPNWFKEQSGGETEVAFAYADVEGDVVNRRGNQEVAEELGLELVGSITELIERSDGIIVLSPDNPEHHWRLSEEALASGKPVYIDKTFATDVDTAKRLFEAAEEHGTPMYSTSALRYSEAYAPFTEGSIESAQMRGPLPVRDYIIHQIEPLLMMMGTDVTRVLAFGPEDYPAFLIEWADGRHATITFTSPTLPFSALITPQGDAPALIEPQDNYFLPFIKDMCAFFHDKAPRVASGDTLANIALLEAVLKAQDQRGTWVDVEH